MEPFHNVILPRGLTSHETASAWSSAENPRAPGSREQRTERAPGEIHLRKSDLCFRLRVRRKNCGDVWDLRGASGTRGTHRTLLLRLGVTGQRPKFGATHGLLHALPRPQRAPSALIAGQRWQTRSQLELPLLIG